MTRLTLSQPAQFEAGIPKMRIEEAAARTQARIDSGRQTIVGVNKYRAADEATIEILRVDNDSVRRQQLDKLARLRGERDEAKVQAALTALTEGARGGGQPNSAQGGGVKADLQQVEMTLDEAERVLEKAKEELAAHPADGGKQRAVKRAERSRSVISSTPPRGARM